MTEIPFFLLSKVQYHQCQRLEYTAHMRQARLSSEKKTLFFRSKMRLARVLNMWKQFNRAIITESLSFTVLALSVHRVWWQRTVCGVTWPDATVCVRNSIWDHAADLEPATVRWRIDSVWACRLNLLADTGKERSGLDLRRRDRRAFAGSPIARPIR